MQLYVTADVIWIPTRLSEQILEELLVIDTGYTTYLSYLGLSCSVPVDEIGCDSDCQLSSELLMLKT